VGAGEARLELLLGGFLKIHANSHLLILQNHSPYLFTLSQGAVSFDLKSSKGDIFFTPDFVIRTEPDPTQTENHFRGEISLEVSGRICVWSRQGRLKITTQDNQNFLSIPSGTNLTLHPGKEGQDPLIYAQNCPCTKLWNNPQKAVLSFRAATPTLHLWRRIGMALHKTLHFITLGWL
jgi:hypothetical protein